MIFFSVSGTLVVPGGGHATFLDLTDNPLPSLQGTEIRPGLSRLPYLGFHSRASVDRRHQQVPRGLVHSQFQVRLHPPIFPKFSKH